MNGWNLLVAVVAAAALLVVVSIIASRRMAKPIRNMADDVRRVQRGDIREVEVMGTREMKTLAHAVNQMAQDLVGRIADLENETRLREKILSSMDVGVVLADSRRRLVYANSAAAQIFGKDEMTEIAPQLSLDGLEQFTLYHPRRKDVSAFSTLLEDGRFLTVLEDVTEFNRLDEIRRDFVANASHELKTPVATVLASAETIVSASQHDPAMVQGFTESLVREAKRLSRLVQDLLDLAKLEGSQPEATPIDLSSLVRRVATPFVTKARSNGLDLHISIEQEVTVNGTEEDFGLLLRNLLENAIEYTAQGKIDVRLRGVGGFASLEVEDTGIGIPTEDRDRIFERFYRVDKGRSRKTGGTGLGLSIVKHVAESVGGRVEIESEVGKGSQFRILIPLSKN